MKNFALLLIVLSCSLGTSFSQNGLHLDGVNDYVQTNYSGISGSAARTVEAWINTTANCNPSNGGVQQIITDWGGTATGARFTLCILWGDAIRLEVAGNGLSGSIAVNDGLWHHVAVVYDPTMANYMKLYVDGVLDVEGIITVPINTASSVNMRIGQRIDAARQFDGKIDEVRVWNTPKSLIDLQANMNNELCSLPADLTAYYRFNNGIADGTNTGLNTVVDLSGTSTNANLVNFALSGTTSNWTTGASLVGGFTTSLTTDNACNSYTWAANGMTYTNSGDYMVTLPGANASNCDSIATLDLTINTASDQTTTVAACDSYTWSVNGMTYSSSAMIVEPQTSTQGCAYDHTLELTINSSSSSSSSVTECDAYFWDTNGATYATTGIYTSNLSTVDGCDSLVTLDLTITDVTSTSTDNGDGTYSADLAGAMYEWLKCTLPASSTGITTQDFMPTQNGDYALITTVNNCSDTSACFTVAGIGLSTLINQAFTIFPNPTEGNITIEVTDAIIYNYVLTDLNGKVLSEKDNILADSYAIELNFPAGFYFIQIEQNGNRTVYPIVKN